MISAQAQKEREQRKAEKEEREAKFQQIAL